MILFCGYRKKRWWSFLSLVSPSILYELGRKGCGGRLPMQQQQHTTKTFQQRRNQPGHGDNRGTGRHCHQKRCQCRHSSQNYSQTVFWWMVYLVFVQDSSKKWKELPKQLNRNTADVEWRAGGDGVDRSRKMGNGQTASLRAKWCFSCYFAFRYIECTLYIFMMWIWFYKTIDIPETSKI